MLEVRLIWRLGYTAIIMGNQGTLNQGFHGKGD